MVSIASISVYCSVAELEPKLFCGTGAGTGAVVSYSGSTASEPKLSFFFFSYNVVSLEDARINKRLISTTTEKYF